MTQSNLVVRYKSGDCHAVRDTLRASINADSTAEEVSVAMAVADDFVSRSINNLRRLYDALLAIEYQFADPDNAFVLHDSPDDEAVIAFEARMGKMPLLAARWYRRIRSINFAQTYKQLTDRQSPLAGLGWNVAFIVESLDQAQEHWLEHFRQHEEDDQYRLNAGLPASGTPVPQLLTGGCASNNDCKGFQLPSFRFDDVLYNDGGGDQYFGDEIAQAFQCGGFPILTAHKSTLKVIHTVYGEPNREFLSTRLPKTFTEV